MQPMGPGTVDINLPEAWDVYGSSADLSGQWKDDAATEGCDFEDGVFMLHQLNQATGLLVKDPSLVVSVRF